MSDTTPRQSILGNLKERREKIQANLHKDIQVPRWADPAPLVRFVPADHDYIQAGLKKIEKAKADTKSRVELEVNIDLLIKHCIGILAKVDDREIAFDPENPDRDDLPVFGPELAVNLGLANDIDEAREKITARQVVKALYFTDGDILSAANELIAWSGYQRTQTDEELRGE